MSEHTVTRKRSRRSPASDGETVAPRTEEIISEATPASSEPPAEIPPVDVKSTLSYRLALGAVIFLGVLIAIGIGVLVVGLAKGWNRPPAALVAKAAREPVKMGLEPGYRILSSDTQPGRLILHVRSDTADEYIIVDLEDGRIVATIRGTPPP